MPPPSDRLVWIDMEMTGLDPSRDFEVVAMAGGGVATTVRAAIGSTIGTLETRVPLGRNSTIRR